MTQPCTLNSSEDYCFGQLLYPLSYTLTVGQRDGIRTRDLPLGLKQLMLLSVFHICRVTQTRTGDL